jgi:hypothetical protein
LPYQRTKAVLVKTGAAFVFYSKKGGVGMNEMEIE